jgi:hypothetical protein
VLKWKSHESNKKLSLKRKIVDLNLDDELQLKLSFEVMSPTKSHLESWERFRFQNRKVMKKKE